MQAAVLKRLDDADWAVRQQLAASLGALPAGARETAAVAFLERHGDDPIALDAALSGLRGSEARCSRSCCRPRRRAPDAAAREPRSRCSPRRSCAARRTAPFRALRVDRRREPRRAGSGAALLRGAEVALLGAAMPGRAGDGTPWRSAGRPQALPCPTCPGGRAGPGGAYAFRAPAAGSRGRRRRPRRRAEPAAEPRAGGAVRAGGARWRARHARAASVLARVEWPGKPGAAAPVAPLDGGGAAALQRGAGGLQEHLPGLPSAGRTRSGQARAQPRRLGACARAAPRFRRASCCTARRAASA